MTMNMINQELSKSFEYWKDRSQGAFVQDGLMNVGRWSDEDYWDEPLRIAFVTKEPYYDNQEDADGEDYRAYNLVEMSEHSRFWKNILTWTYGLYNTNIHGYPAYDDASEFSSRKIAFENIPFSLVNVKKTCGGSTTNKGILRNYAQTFVRELSKELRTILCPNIIVCCGTQDVISKIIYKDYNLLQIDNEGWTHYDKEHDTLFIWTYHPSARMSDKYIYDSMINSYCCFLNKYPFPIKKSN